MTEVSPDVTIVSAVTYPRPPVSIARMAERLVKAYIDEDGFPCPLRADEIPQIPEEVAAKFNPEQQAKYKQDAATSADIALFASRLRQPANGTALRSINYPHAVEQSYLADRGKKLPNFRLRQRKADGAILRYFMAIDKAKEVHLADPALEELRKYRDTAQSESGSNFTLEISYKAGLDTLNDNSRAMSAFCFKKQASAFRRRNRFTQPIPDIMRASMPTIRFLAAMAIAKNQAATKASGDFMKFFQYAKKDGQEYVRINKRKMRRHIRRNGEYFNHPSTKGRTNNSCPALAPVRGVSNIGALESIFLQQIDVLEEQGIWDN